MLGGAGTNVCFGGPTDIMIACTLGGTEPPDPTLGASEVPEPATVLLVASGIGAFAARWRRRRP